MNQNAPADNDCKPPNDAAAEAAKAQGYNSADYDWTFFVTINNSNTCPVDVHGNTGTRGSLLDERHVQSPHEWGHAFGLAHASAQQCKDPSGQLVPLSANCSFSAYGDYTDVMGAGYAYHENAFYKLEAGWLGDNNHAVITKTGDYTLTPLETASSGLQLIEVPRGSRFGTSEFYFLDFRQAIGYDASAFLAGVFLRTHLAVFPRIVSYPPSNPTDRYDSFTGDTMLIKAGVTGTRLSIGQTITDFAVPGLSIKLVSQTTTSAVVHIEFPADLTPPAAPAVRTDAPLIVSGVDTGGNTIFYWNEAPDNLTWVEKYHIYRDGARFDTISQRSKVVSEGKFYDYSYQVLWTKPVPGSPTGTPDNAAGHDYYITALDLAGNESARSATYRCHDITHPNGCYRL